MNILLIFIYNKNDLYDNMLNIQQKYLNDFKKFNGNNIIFYFVTYKNDINNIVIDNNIIYIKGEESLLNILNKTILSIEYLITKLDLKFDFIIRLNISTIINIPELIKYLYNLPKFNVYTSGHILNLNWIDFDSGIFDKSYFNIKYASGTNIIFSYDVINNIIINKHLLKYDIIDDISIGIYINIYYSYLLDNLYKYKPKMIISNNNNNFKNKYLNNYIFYRNKNNISRLIDIENMKKIIYGLYNIYY